MDKGSTKLLVMIGLVALLACSWYMLIDDTARINNQYNQYIENGRQKAEAGLHQVALENFELARGMNDTIELRNEMAQVYQEYGNGPLYEEFCTLMTTDFPYEKIGYERLAKFYHEKKEYTLFYNVKSTAQKRGVSSSVIDSIAADLEYAYSLDGVSAAQIVGSCSSTYTAVRSNGKWGLLNEKGKTVLGFNYNRLSVFANDMIYAETADGNYVLLDQTGKYVSRVGDDRKIEDCSAINAGKMAVKYNGKYHYCDENFKELFGSYDFATVFNGGVAVVMNGEKWAIVNEKGEQVTDFIFEDFKLDDAGIAFRSGCAIAKKDGAYMIVDKTGKKIGSGTWEDADAFNSDMIAAVKKGGKWGFVDANGKEVVSYQYEGAKSFSNGMAAVQINGKWGFIRNSDFALKIEAIFDDAMDFTKSGSAFVHNGSAWNLLQIYRMAQ